MKSLWPTLCLAVGFLTVSLWADTPQEKFLSTVEQRYNRAQTLEVQFQQLFSAQGKGRRTESGTLYLRKPGRMRWTYAEPKDKLFLSDGKNFWFYSPAANRVEKMKLKESDDLRAPLAFLLGKLNFKKDFASFDIKEEGENRRIQAQPKSDKLPYRDVVFLASPAGAILELKITGQDASIMEFKFAGEKLNVPMKDSLFKFEMPAGAELVEDQN